ncbi:hypothetical protein WK53_25475 [Burkholderia ubonensis]|uniref:Uncharacterized protein n=1 Tax=Burkholderia ubonensis TaxID=101571 RepID=A0AAW3NIL6_9BURK|nr:hypothetical protein WK53_25475 [Burkholderia ubonensis]
MRGAAFTKMPVAATYNGRISRRPRPGRAHAALDSLPVAHALRRPRTERVRMSPTGAFRIA